MSFSLAKTSDKPKRKFPKKSRRIIIIALILAFFTSLVASNFCIKITKEVIYSEKIDEPLRIALISDLHSRSYGEKNEVLINKIEKESPDLILMAGDILTQDSENKSDFEYLTNLVSSLSKISPVYFVIGNQERFNSSLDVIRSCVILSGGVILDDEYTDISLKGNRIRIGGLSYYRFWDEDANAFLSDFADTDSNTFTLLLCHHPEFYQWGVKNFSIDLVVSGHTHGGMLKLPLIGPVYAPEQGWFPEYGAGLYKEDNGYLAVTTGLASSPAYLPRFFNSPEIMIIDLK